MRLGLTPSIIQASLAQRLACVHNAADASQNFPCNAFPKSMTPETFSAIATTPNAPVSVDLQIPHAVTIGLPSTPDAQDGPQRDSTSNQAAHDAAPMPHAAADASQPTAFTSKAPL
eukprot:4149510-Amphidinium_carterae.1